MYKPYAIGIDIKLPLSEKGLHGRQRTGIIKSTLVVIVCGKIISTTLTNSYWLHCNWNDSFLDEFWNYLQKR